MARFRILQTRRNADCEAGSVSAERKNMIKQPERGSRNVNDFFYEAEGRRIQKINKVLEGVELTKAEERTLIWIAGWEESTVDNLLSVIEKRLGYEPINRADTPI